MVGAGAPGLDGEGMPEGGGIAEARLEKAGDDVGSRPYLERLRRRPRLRRRARNAPRQGRAAARSARPPPSRFARVPAGFLEDEGRVRDGPVARKGRRGDDQPDRENLRALCESVGVDPAGDDPLLAALAAPGLSWHCEHDEAARELIPDVLKELRRHRDEIETLRAATRPRGQRSYAQISDAVEGLYPPAPWASWRELMGARDAPRARRSRLDGHRIRTTGTVLDAFLREYLWQLDLAALNLERTARWARHGDGTEVADAPPLPAPKTGPAPKDGLAEAGRDVYAVLKARGHPSALKAAVLKLEEAGWSFAPGSLDAKVRQLKTRLRRLNPTRLPSSPW